MNPSFTTPYTLDPLQEKGRFGPFGGALVPPALAPVLQELAEAYDHLAQEGALAEELSHLLGHYAGRPTPLTEVPRYAEALGAGRVFLKREDLLHTGAHKLNNALGQALLARHMGKTHVVAETGAGQHGVATATAAARLGLRCTVFMGAVDAARQRLNVFRMKLLGAEVIEVQGGLQTLKDAVDEALNYYVEHARDTFYLLGSAVGPHPYPSLVREFQKVISLESRAQMLQQTGALPDVLVACVGGGSNAIGAFHAYLNDEAVCLVGVEGGGRGLEPGQHAARFATGRPGVLHGMATVVLLDENDQVQPTHSVSAGMDYPGVGPQHAYLHATGRAQYRFATDAEALREFHRLVRLEGILPALESAHALAGAARLAPELGAKATILVNLSGRGDKDVAQVAEMQAG
ncbi:MAG: tryptophan synthase subunit beta [Firmicutes bacterium]|nr:tryptophan synthase subunit beta [Bacillota bacterium]